MPNHAEGVGGLAGVRQRWIKVVLASCCLAACDAGVARLPLEGGAQLPPAPAAQPPRESTPLKLSPQKLLWSRTDARLMSNPVWDRSGWTAVAGYPPQLLTSQEGRAIVSRPLGELSDVGVVHAASSEDGLLVMGVKGAVGKTLLGDTGKAYVARFDKQGDKTWERVLGPSRLRVAFAAEPHPAGGLVVAGLDRGVDRTWVVRLSPNRRLLWHREFGVGKGAALAVVEGDIYIAGMERSQGSSTSEELAVYSLAAEGRVNFRQTVRQPMDRVWDETVALAAAADGVYLLSSGYHPHHPAPLEVAKIGPRGVIWNRSLKGYVEAASARGCGAAAIRPDRLGVAIACGAEDGMTILRLSGDGGEVNVGDFATEACLVQGAAQVRVDASRWPLMLAGAARPSGNARSGCAWIGTLSAS